MTAPGVGRMAADAWRAEHLARRPVGERIMRVGRHETVREIRRSGAASVWEIESGGPSGGDARGAVKLLQPPPFWLESERAERIDQFLRRAAVQAKVSGRHWAPVHDRGEDENGAFYVTDLYAQSAEQLIRRTKSDLDGEGLYRLINGVVAGLEELQASAGRTHGRLTPGNVLLTADDPRAASVALSDPGLDPKGGVAVDCHAVGELIYALVLRQMPKPGAVAEASAAWSGLGPRGEVWRELCNRLLDPARPVGSLEELREAVAECKPPVVSTKRVRSLGITVGVLAAIVLGVSGYLFYQYQAYRFDLGNWQELCDESKWLGPFVKGLRDGGNFDVVVKELPGIEVLRGMERVTAGEISGETNRSNDSLRANPPEGAKDRQAVRDTQFALKAARAVKKVVESDWPLRTAMVRAGEKFAEFPFSLPALLKERATETRLEDPKLASNMATLIRFRDWVGTLDALGDQAKVIRTSDDPELKGLVKLLDDQLNSGLGPGDLSKVRRIEETTRRVAAKVTEMAQRKFDEPRFRKERALTGNDGLDRLNQWADQSESYRKLEGNENPLDTEPRVNWRESGNSDEDVALGVAPGQEVPWDQLLVGIDAEVVKLKDDPQGDPEVARQVEPDVRKLTAVRDELKRLEPVRKDATKVREAVQAFVRDAKGVRRRVGLALVRDSKAEIEKFAASTNDQIGQIKPAPGLEEVAAVHRAQLERIRDTDPKVMRLWRKKVERQALEAFFGNLAFDTKLGAGPGKAAGRGWLEGVVAQVDAEAKRRALAVVKGVRWEPRPAPKTLEGVGDKARSDFAAWKLVVERLVVACVALEDRLNEYPSPVAAAGGGPGVEQLLAPLEKAENPAEVVRPMSTVLGRAQEWVAMAKAAPDGLRAMIEKGDRGQFKFLDGHLAAWWRADRRMKLGASDVARRELLARIDAEAVPARAQALRADVAKTWLTEIVIPQVTRPPADRAHEVMREAVALLEQSPKPPLTMADLKDHPECLHNVAVYRLVAAVEAKGKDPEVERLMGEVLGEKAGGGAVEGALSLLRERSAAAAREKATGTPPENAGPGGAGWAYKREGELLHSYTKNRVKLVFVDVEGTNCFLCQTEVSVEVAIEAGLKVNAEPGGVPLTWMLYQGQILPAADWFGLGPKGIQYKPAAGDWTSRTGTRRSSRYPMNLISPRDAEALAKLLKCRLPTEEEWAKAYGLETRGGASPVVWNLRDPDSWAEHDKLLADDRAKERETPPKPREFKELDPTSKSWVLAGGSAAAAPASGGNLPPKDGHVFFQEIDNENDDAAWKGVGRGRLFYHLVGNVAEYVWGQVNGKPGLVAIGGSALSTLPVDQPIELRGRGGYSDVGVRLAFDRPIKPLYVRLNLPSHGQGLYLVEPVAVP